MKRINHNSGGENLIGILLSISIGFALILFSSGRTNAHSTEIQPANSSISKRIRVQQIYISQIGIREKHPNSGLNVEKYLRYVHLPKGNPWCTAFVCWVFGQAGVLNPRTGWSPGLFPNSKVIWSKRQIFKIAESRKLKAEASVPGIKTAWPAERYHVTRLPQNAPTSSSNTILINQTAIRCHIPRWRGQGVDLISHCPPPATSSASTSPRKNASPTSASSINGMEPG